MPRFASMRQPKGQELHCTQLPALREIGPRRRCRGAGPSIASWPLRPIARGRAAGTRRNSSASAKRGPRSRCPLDAVALAPLLEDGAGSAKAGAGVDHRGAADRAGHRDGDRRVALGDRQAGVAVEGGDCVERVSRIAVAVKGRARLEDDHVEARLGEARSRHGSTGAGADDDDVAFLALAARFGVAQRPGRLRQRAVGETAAGLEADPARDLGSHRIAEGREDLGHQHQLAVEPERDSSMRRRKSSRAARSR